MGLAREVMRHIHEGIDMDKGWYDVAQICLNGHVINWTSAALPQSNKKFCDKCGARTISTCESCGKDIRGAYLDGWDNTIHGHHPAAFCHECGQAYPWTDAALTAARELSDELENLSEEERKVVKASVDDIVADTPRTTLAATRFKRLVSKAGKESLAAFRTLLVDIASETAKKTIWP